MVTTDAQLQDTLQTANHVWTNYILSVEDFLDSHILY
jgi:hypothetical protein